MATLSIFRIVSAAAYRRKSKVAVENPQREKKKAGGLTDWLLLLDAARDQRYANGRRKGGVAEKCWGGKVWCLCYVCANGKWKDIETKLLRRVHRDMHLHT